MSPMILKFCTSLEVSGWPHASTDLSPVKQPRQSLNTKLDGLQSLSAHFGLKSNFLLT